MLLAAPVAIFSGVIFGSECLRIGKIPLAIIDFSMAVLYLVAWYVAYRKPESTFPCNFSAVSTSLFFFYLFVSGGIEGLGILWSLVIPLIAFFLTGFQVGGRICGAYLLMTVVAIFYDCYSPGLLYHYEYPFLLRFYGVYLLILIVAGAYEYHKEKIEHALFELLYAAEEDKNRIALSELRYRALFEGTGQGVIVASIENPTILEANPAAHELFGYEMGHLKGIPIKNIHPDELTDKILALFQKNASSHRSMVSQLPCRKADGTIFYSDLFTTVLNIDNHPCVVGFFSDVSEKVKAERELINARKAADAANEAKSFFLANMSHEIRTPLNGIIGMTELLNLTSLTDEQQKYAEIIRQSGQSLLTLLSDVLDFSKIESGKMAIENLSFDLIAVVEEVCSQIRFKAESKGLELKTEIFAGCPTKVFGDSIRVRQILINLLDNAIKFTTSGSVRLKISGNGMTHGRQNLLFEVIDTGIGIPEEKIPFLFQSFSQLDVSTTRLYGGTGLGLSICSKLAHLMGGDIGVISTFGSGTNFWFSIPFAVEKARTDADAEPTAEKPTGKRAVEKIPEVKPEQPDKSVPRQETWQILLGDDNSTNFLVVQAMLAKIGARVDFAENGHEIILALKRKKYDLVLLDLHMPMLDGFETYSLIQRNIREGFCYSVPVVVITADAFAKTRETCFEMGMQDFISKPFNMPDFLATVKKWLPER